MRDPDWIALAPALNGVAFGASRENSADEIAPGLSR